MHDYPVRPKTPCAGEDWETQTKILAQAGPSEESPKLFIPWTISQRAATDVGPHPAAGGPTLHFWKVQKGRRLALRQRC